MARHKVGRVQRQPIFAGLRVRMSMHTDVADVISMHEITQKPLYCGSVYDFAEGLSEFAKGGQVVVSPGTLGRVSRDERRMHRASAALDAALAKVRQTVQRRENAGLDLTTRIIKCALPPSPLGMRCALSHTLRSGFHACWPAVAWLTLQQAGRCNSQQTVACGAE